MIGRKKKPEPSLPVMPDWEIGDTDRLEWLLKWWGLGRDAIDMQLRASSAFVARKDKLWAIDVLQGHRDISACFDSTGDTTKQMRALASTILGID